MSSSKRDSYSERRDLFRNIWDTAMNLDNNIETAKTKNIKTMYLSDSVTPTARRIALERARKHRLRNLRIVAKKIQEFCDRQDLENKMTKKSSKRLRKRRRLKPKKKTQPVVEASSAGTSKNLIGSIIVQPNHATPAKKISPAISVVPRKISSVKSSAPVSTSSKVPSPLNTLKEYATLAVPKIVRLPNDSLPKRNSVTRRKQTPFKTTK